MLTRIALGVLRLLHGLLPAAALGKLGAWLGGGVYWLAGSRRHIGAVNLRLCFPELSDAQRARLLRAHFRALGRATLQETVSWWGGREAVASLTRFEGLEHFQRHASRPLILLAPHFVGLNIGGVRVSQLPFTFASMYSPIRNAALDRLMLHARTRFGQSRLIARNQGIKPVLRALRQGEPFYYLPDMDYGAKDAVFVPFFGVPAATLTSLSRLARITAAVVLPCVTRQTPEGYVTRFYPAWEDFPGDDLLADARRMNAFIEERVREMPEQYFWLHKRFKTQPEGTRASLYARR